MKLLARFLETAPEYHVGVQKTFFTYLTTPFGKDAAAQQGHCPGPVRKGDTGDCLQRGDDARRNCWFSCRALALSSEELAMKSGISSILWENGVTHIKVTEAGLDEVITTKTEQGWEQQATARNRPADRSNVEAKKNASMFTGRTLVLGILMTDPGRVRRQHGRTCKADARRARKRGRPSVFALSGGGTQDQAGTSRRERYPVRGPGTVRPFPGTAISRRA